MLQRHCHIEAKLQNINKILPNVAVIRSEGEKFRETIDKTNKLAETVSAKVRQLDLARVIYLYYCLILDLIILYKKLINLNFRVESVNVRAESTTF